MNLKELDYNNFIKEDVDNFHLILSHRMSIAEFIEYQKKMRKKVFDFGCHYGVNYTSLGEENGEQLETF